MSTNTSESRIQDTKVEIKPLFPLPISEPEEKNQFKFSAINIDRTPQKITIISEVSLESTTEAVTGNFESPTGSEGRLRNRNGSQILPNLRQIELLKLYTDPKSVPSKLHNGKDPASLRNFDKTQSLLCCNTASDASISESCSPPTKRCRVALYEVKGESLNPISAREDTKNSSISQNRVKHSMQSTDLLDVSICHFKALEVKMMKKSPFFLEKKICF